MFGVTRKRKRLIRKIEDSESGSDSNDHLFVPDWKVRMRRHNYSESSSHDAVHPGTDDQGCKSEPKDHDGDNGSSDEEREVTGHSLVEYSSNEGNGDCCEENLLKRKGRSEEVDTASHPGAVTTPKDGGTEAASLLSTSSESSADLSGEQLLEGPSCFICLAKFIAQQVGITDTCNHIFCLTCLQECQYLPS